MINHQGDDMANVRLQWSEKHSSSFDVSFETMTATSESTKLLLELVTLRKIRKGEELYLDYGDEWSNAWNKHLSGWKPLSNHTSASSSQMNEHVDLLRTERELRQKPYPENVFTSCFFKYYDRNKPNQESASSSPHVNVETVPWEETSDIYEPRNLRPCSVLDRHEHPSSPWETVYTVRILNRPGLSELERIPKGHALIVTEVPRVAIQFSDKLYTTNQHLVNAFRHEIGLDVFPKEWMDLGPRG